MGCDIHFYVERKAGNEWKSADKWISEDEVQRVPYEDQFYSGRNYDLFAILANVRNGRGFAGVKTGTGFIPISAPRGLPQDVTQEVRQSSDCWDCDGHSHSWLLLSELLAFDWEQVTQHQGYVDESGYSGWKTKGSPSCWCGDVGGAAKKVSNKEMEEAIANGTASHIYTPVRWSESYRSCVGSFLTETLPNLKLLGEPQNVRIVFWFDN